MSATVLGDTIYIDKKLDARLTPGERRVLLAHEIAHYQNKDRLKILLLMIAIIGLSILAFVNGHIFIGIALTVSFAYVIHWYQRQIELRADRFALYKTKDFDSFISLMDKLEHDGTSHPGKAERILLAEKMREEHEHNSIAG